MLKSEFRRKEEVDEVVGIGGGKCLGIMLRQTL